MRENIVPKITNCYTSERKKDKGRLQEAEDKCNLRTPKRAATHPIPVDEDFVRIC